MHLAADCRTGRTRAGAAGIPVRAHFEGPCLSFHFALIFFLKGPCASVGSPEPEFAWTSVPHFLFFYFLDSLHTVLLRREKLGRAMLGPGWKTAGSSPQGLI